MLFVDSFEKSLEEAAAKAEARMLKLVVALEELPEIVRYSFFFLISTSFESFIC